MRATDEDLALAAAGGDVPAFEALLARSYDQLFSLCFRLTGRRAEAEDLTQDICLALPTKLRGYRGQAKFKTWLYRVAVNAAIDRRRRVVSYSKALDGWGDWEIARQAESEEARDHLSWLDRAMKSLSEPLRDTIALVLDDLTHAEVAEILEISEGTVSWRVSEAKKHLKALKQKEEGL